MIADPAGGTLYGQLESNVTWTVTSKVRASVRVNMESGKAMPRCRFRFPETGDDVTGNITVKATSSTAYVPLTIKQDRFRSHSLSR